MLFSGRVIFVFFSEIGKKMSKYRTLLLKIFISNAPRIDTLLASRLLSTQNKKQHSTYSTYTEKLSYIKTL